MKPRPIPFAARREAGLSLVELMVGMLIGLIGIVIITHLYLQNEQYKRSTTAAGGAQANGAIALYVIERDLRMAGYGINHSGALGCGCAGAGCSPLQYYYNGNYSFPPAPSAAGALAPLDLAPVVIGDGAGSPDTITVLYGGDAERMLPASIAEITTAPEHDYKVDGTAGFEPTGTAGAGNLVVVTQGATCVLQQVTLVEQTSAKLQHRFGVAGVPFNPPSNGLFPAFGTGALVFDLGTSPTWRRFSISSNRLQAEEVLGALGGAAAQVLVDDIVDMQAEYGKDNGVNNGTVTQAVYAADDGIVDSWDSVKPVGAAQWQQVLAIRVGVLARSKNYEKPSVAGGPCEATTAAPTWSGSVNPTTLAANPQSVFTVPEGLPSCYRYRVFETIIPLRNMIWRPA